MTMYKNDWGGHSSLIEISLHYNPPCQSEELVFIAFSWNLQCEPLYFVGQGLTVNHVPHVNKHMTFQTKSNIKYHLLVY